MDALLQLASEADGAQDGLSSPLLAASRAVNGSSDSSGTSSANSGASSSPPETSASSSCASQSQPSQAQPPSQLARLRDFVHSAALAREPGAGAGAGDAVSLMTIHSAKGKEAEVVFVVSERGVHAGMYVRALVYGSRAELS